MRGFPGLGVDTDKANRARIRSGLRSTSGRRWRGGGGSRVDGRRAAAAGTAGTAAHRPARLTRLPLHGLLLAGRPIYPALRRQSLRPDLPPSPSPTHRLSLLPSPPFHLTSATLRHISPPSTSPLSLVRSFQTSSLSLWTGLSSFSLDWALPHWTLRSASVRFGHVAAAIHARGLYKGVAQIKLSAAALAPHCRSLLRPPHVTSRTADVTERDRRLQQRHWSWPGWACRRVCAQCDCGSG